VPAKPDYILDACALIAFLDDEEGADIFEDMLVQARNNQITLHHERRKSH